MKLPGWSRELLLTNCLLIISLFLIDKWMQWVLFIYQIFECLYCNPFMINYLFIKLSFILFGYIS